MEDDGYYEKMIEMARRKMYFAAGALSRERDEHLAKLSVELVRVADYICRYDADDIVCAGGEE